MPRRPVARRQRAGGLALLLAALALLVYWLTQPDAAPAPLADALRGRPAGEPAGARADWYEIHFTTPRYPDDPKLHRGGVDERLVALLDGARRSADLAVYDFDLASVADALVRAQGRGARVRLVTDADTVENTRDERVQAAFRKLRAAGVPIVADERPAIMHHKFTVVDGEWVSTGSWNYTDGDTYRLNNWMGVFRSPELAAAYTAEFEQLAAGRFGPAKAPAGARLALVLGGSRVQLCFSPKGSCAELVASTIRQEARRSVYFLAFSFTHDEIGRAIVEKKQAGLTVAGVFETTGSQTAFSEYGNMKRAGLDVYLDGNPYSMHHKVIVVDERLVIAGSFNFSSNADKDNDENLLIVDDPTYARAFKAEFDRVLDQAKNPPARN